MFCIGKYQVERLISDKGGFGLVFEVHHPDLNERCALKVFLPVPGVSQEHLLQVRKESQKMARLRQHKNIVQEFDAGIAAPADAQGHPVDLEGNPLQTPREYFYILMERMDGSLADWVGKLDRKQAEWVFREAAEGVGHIHTCGYVHQDIKPANILVRYAADGETIREVKLSDFGLSIATDTQGSSLLLQRSGTASYMAQEVLQGHPATQASDIYSLGATFYEVWTGRLPEQADRSPRPSSVRRGLPRKLDKLILSMLKPQTPAEANEAPSAGTNVRPGSQ